MQLGVPRLINISSEQAPGFFSNHGPPGGAVTASAPAATRTHTARLIQYHQPTDLPSVPLLRPA